MTQARHLLFNPSIGGLFHCVQRCVRRSFLCGIDDYTGQDFSHRKSWVESRLSFITDCFAVSVHAYAVMSNHLHVVLEMAPAVAHGWSNEDVASRWVQLFPPREAGDVAIKIATLCRSPERLALLRERLCDLSWFMKCLAEPIARRANREDACTGRFWEGRFKAQRLCDERALLAAMVYVDLNPVRAGLVQRLEASNHTSVQQRIAQAVQAPERLKQPLIAFCGQPKAMSLSLGDYLGLVEYSGQQLSPNKRGRLAGKQPRILSLLEQRPERWIQRVKGIGSGYWRLVGEMSDLTDWACQLGQRWVKGMGLARQLAKA